MFRPSVAAVLLCIFLLNPFSGPAKAQTVEYLLSDDFEKLSWSEDALVGVLVVMYRIADSGCQMEDLEGTGTTAAEYAEVLQRLTTEHTKAVLAGRYGVGHPAAYELIDWLAARGDMECGDSDFQRLIKNGVRYIMEWDAQAKKRALEEYNAAREEALHYDGYRKYSWEHTPRITNFEEVFRAFVDSLEAYPYEQSFFDVRVIVDPQGQVIGTAIDRDGEVTIPSEAEVQMASRIVEMMEFSPATDYDSEEPGWLEISFQWRLDRSADGLSRDLYFKWLTGTAVWESTQGYIRASIRHMSYIGRMVLPCGWIFENQEYKGPSYYEERYGRRHWYQSEECKDYEVAR